MKSATFSSSRDPCVTENSVVYLADSGEVGRLSLPDLSRQVSTQVIKKEDVVGIRCLTFSNTGNCIYLCSSSEVQRVDVSAMESVTLKELHIDHRDDGVAEEDMRTLQQSGCSSSSSLSIPPPPPPPLPPPVRNDVQISEPGLRKPLVGWGRFRTTSTANTPAIWDCIAHIDVPQEVLKFKSRRRPTIKSNHNIENIKENPEHRNIEIKMKTVNKEILKELLKSDPKCNDEGLETAEKVEHLLKTYSKDFKELKANPPLPLQFPAMQSLWDLSQIHQQLDDRVSCLILRNNFQGRCDEIKNRVNNLKSCCQFLSTDLNLRKVLEIILGKLRLGIGVRECFSLWAGENNSY